MRCAFYVSEKGRDLELAKAFNGCFPVTYIPDRKVRDGFDLHCVIGLKQRAIKEQIEAAGFPYLYWDKAFDRDQWPEKWRFVYCGQQPGRYIHRLKFPDDRIFNRGRFSPWREQGRHIVIGGWSNKASVYFGIEEPNAYASAIIKRLRDLGCRREVLYRAKPSYRGQAPVDGAAFSQRGQRPVTQDLDGAHALITYASGTCFDAMLAGVPSIVLSDDAIMAPYSSRSLDEIENPQLASDAERHQLLCNAGYHQWTLDELRGGAAREAIRIIIEKYTGDCTRKI